MDRRRGKTGGRITLKIIRLKSIGLRNGMTGIRKMEVFMKRDMRYINEITFLNAENLLEIYFCPFEFEGQVFSPKLHLSGI